MAGRLSLLRQPRSRRRWTVVLLAVAVAAAHLWVAEETLDASLGFGAADTRPARINVAFVRQLAPVAPAAAPAPAPRRQPPAQVLAAAAPASAASAAAPVPEPSAPPEEPAAVVAAVPEPQPASAPEPAGAAPLVAEAASAAVSAPAAPAAVEWPPSTRLTYSLSGNYRGPVEGQAQVQWLLAGTRYQVHLDVSVGPSFAPLLARRHSSDGEVTERGLQPRRYDEEFKVVFRDVRRTTMLFDADGVHLANGKTVPRPEGVQDSASQFVQLVWLFTTQPALLTPGRTIDIPLALPRYVDTWTYEVLARETLATPFGAVDTFHVMPRRTPRPGVELMAEMWVAPSLQYLPVRILIRQDADTYVDLLITTLPLQAAPTPANPANPGDRR